MNKPLFLLALLLPAPAFAQDGALDTDFSADGMQFTLLAAHASQAYDAVQLPDGHLLVAGEAAEAVPENGIGVAKYAPDGELDASFGDGGIVYLEPGTGQQYCYGIALQEDGGIILAGATQDVGEQMHVLVVRLLPDGGPDPAFASDGIARVALGTGNATAFDVALQQDGKIVVAGALVTGGNSDLFVARLLTDGTLDGDFGLHSGYALVDQGNADAGRCLSIDGAGIITVAGFTTGFELLTAQYLTDGTPNPAFGFGGIYTMDGWGFDQVKVCMTTHEGTILICGAAGLEAKVVRVLAEGGAALVGTHDAGGAGLVPNSIAVQADGRIIIGGTQANQAIVARLDDEGEADASFGPDGDGFVLEDIGTGSTINGVLVQADQRIVVVGKAIQEGHGTFFLARHYSGVHVGADGPAAPIAHTVLMPNPANGPCVLALTLAHPDRLSAVVQDAQGRTVRRLFTNEPFPAGTQRRTLDLSGMAPGAYRLMLRNTAGRVLSTGLIAQ